VGGQLQGWSLKRIVRHYGITATLVALAIKHIPLEKFKPGPKAQPWQKHVPTIKRKHNSAGITSAGLDLDPENAVDTDLIEQVEQRGVL
jgi:hypothetical protein